MGIQCLSVALIKEEGVFLRITSAPQPLNGREQVELLRKFRENGDERLRNKVIETSMRLVYHMVKKFKGSTLSDDDLASAGSLGLLKAANTFKPERGTKFPTYAARCIENEILMELRWFNKHNTKSISLQDPIGTDSDGNELYLSDVMAGNMNATEEEAIRDERMVIVSEESMRRAGLKERSILVLQLRYGLITGRSCTQRSISEQIGISRSYVSRIEQKALKKLRIKYEALIN